MKCKMCGAELKKEGDICKNCYEKYKKQEILRSDDEEVLFSIKRKYSPKFNLLKNGEVIVLALIIILAGFSAYSTLAGIGIMILTVLAFGGWMFFNKVRAIGTKTTFYETKLRYQADYLFVHRDEFVPYNDMKDMQYFQTRSQKICNIGDIRFYTKGFLNGLTISDIPDIKENFEKIRSVINATR